MLAIVVQLDHRSFRPSSVTVMEAGQNLSGIRDKIREDKANVRHESVIRAVVRENNWTTQSIQAT